MARSFSTEAKLFRGLLAVAAGASLFGCARPNSRQVTETPTPIPPKQLPCDQAEFYPPDGQKLLQSATYYLEMPRKHGCGIELYLDEYRDIYLLIYADKIEFIVFENQIGQYLVKTLPLPTEGQAVEFSWGNGDISGKVTLIEGYYTVTYTAPESRPPATPMPTPAPWPDGWTNRG